MFFKNRLTGTLFFAEGDGAGAGGGAGGAGGAPGAGTGAPGGGADKLSAAREAAKAAGTHLVDDWREALPEDIATDGSLADFKDWRDIPKSYIHTKKLVGKDKIAIPGENATDEERAAFFAALGRPAEPGAYAFDAPKEPPAGYQYPKALEGDFKKWAHDAGLSAAQAKKVWGNIVNHTIANWKEGSGKAAGLRQKDVEALKADWGANFKAREDLALKAFSAVNAKLGQEHAMPRELLANPRFMRAFAHIGELAAEDRLGDAGTPGGIISAREAKSRIAEIQSDKKGPYWDDSHPRHKAIKQEVEGLYKLAWPD